MRLVAGILIPPLAAGAGLAAQAPREHRLAWEAQASILPWQATEGELSPPPDPPTAPPALDRKGDLRVRLTPDGRLRAVDRRGVLRVNAGLPGRVSRMWRDGGLEVDPRDPDLRLSAKGPLSRGVADLPWARPDFRPGLEGLLWILDDGERVLTLVHPATGRVQYLALPPLSDPELAFGPQHLELRERPAAGAPPSGRRRWTLPWTALLPAFLKLAQPPAENRHGTAFKPFPRD